MDEIWHSCYGAKFPFLPPLLPTDLKIITRFGQYEFKFGDADRGRTIFEGIVTNNPKRVDLWSVYLDMELRIGNVDIIRYGRWACAASARSPPITGFPPVVSKYWEIIA